MATHSSILAWRIPWTEELAGCSPWGLKESDTTEQLRTPAHSTRQICGVAASLFLAEETVLLGVKTRVITLALFFFFAQESQAWYEWQPLRVWITSSTSVDYTQNYIGSYQERETAYIHLIFLFIKFTPWNKWKNQFSFLCFLPRNFKVFPKICITRNHSFGFIKEMGGNTFQVYKI